MMRTVYVKISGRVQGVFFRFHTKKQAEALDVKGWVRNSKDGTVEAVFEGDKEQVEKLVAWCHIGSPQSRVEEVVVTPMDVTVGCRSFSIIH
jgi:acylphosphatase